MLNGLDPDQNGHSVHSDLGQNFCKGYQQLTKVAARKERVTKENICGASILYLQFQLAGHPDLHQIPLPW